MQIDAKDGGGEYGITDLARRQLADKLKIPFAYFERMRTEQPALLDGNVNTWLQTDTERRMMRTLDGQVRAVLSDRYRRLDNYDLAENVLPILQRLPECALRVGRADRDEDVSQGRHATGRVRNRSGGRGAGRHRDHELRSRPAVRCRCSRWCTGWYAATV